MKYFKMFEEYQNNSDNIIKTVVDRIYSRIMAYDYDMIINHYTEEVLYEKLKEYRKFIESVSINNKLILYRGLRCNPNDVLFGDEQIINTQNDVKMRVNDNPDNFCNSYTLKKDVAEDYGSVIIKANIDINDIDWDSTLLRLREKISNEIENDAIEDFNIPFSEIDIEFEINPKTYKSLNDLKVLD